MKLANEVLLEMKQRLSYDPLTGLFTAIRHHYRSPIGSIVGSKAGWRNKYKNPKGYYLCTSLGGKQYLLHRLAWLWVYGEWPKHDIDHIDGNPSNNKITNLRDVSKSINCQNRTRVPMHSKTGVMGVSGNRTYSFVARIRVDGRQIKLGHFKTIEEAHQAYLDAKRKLHGGCTI